ncbi:MAG TPA: TIGR03013 family XrtA/PEP-CTERM system glycosyltransferase [Burkholderiaceae bacterium]
MFRIGNHFVSKSVSLLLAFEFLILLGAAYAGAGFRFDSNYLFTAKAENYSTSAFVFAAVMSFSMTAFGMYQGGVRDGLRNTILRLMPASLLCFGILTLLFYLIPHLYFGRGILGFVFLSAIVGILITRTVYFESSRSKYLRTRIMFLGAGKVARECSTLAENDTFANKYSIVGFMPTPGEQPVMQPGQLITMSGDSICATADRYHVQEIVVSVENRRDGAIPIKDLLECKLRGIKVTDATAFFEREACQIRIDALQPSWLVFGTGFDQSFLRMFGKRTFDVIVSSLLFIVSLPIMLLTALAIKLEDRGPVFYAQERVGKGGKSFMVLKFRSMRSDAETAGKPQWAQSNDPRVTRVGRFIRMCRIDELPQIINVMNGEMSFVGPRPERPYFVQQLVEQVPYYNIRHSIKPGITGMAQVRYQYGASVTDSIQKLQYDLYYVKNNSLFLDALILMDTLQVVLFGKGAR